MRRTLLIVIGVLAAAFALFLVFDEDESPAEAEVMATAGVLNRVEADIVEVLGVDADSVVPGAEIVGDLGADDLDVDEILDVLHEDFGVEITEDQWRSELTVEELAGLVQELLDEE